MKNNINFRSFLCAGALSLFSIGGVISSLTPGEVCASGVGDIWSIANFGRVTRIMKDPTFVSLGVEARIEVVRDSLSDFLGGLRGVLDGTQVVGYNFGVDLVNKALEASMFLFLQMASPDPFHADCIMAVNPLLIVAFWCDAYCKGRLGDVDTSRSAALDLVNYSQDCLIARFGLRGIHINA